ncbi:MAG TPA: hypothetical protein VGS79_18920 [Puia sp.]|nr:hypothetical protein [Puia sp.]
MGPGFESQRDHLMGQVDENVTCPIFFLGESRVQPVYQPHCLIDPRGSKIFAVKNQFFRKDRTDDLPLLDRRRFDPHTFQLRQVLYRLIEHRPHVSNFFRHRTELCFEYGDLFFAFCFDRLEIQTVNIS